VVVSFYDLHASGWETRLILDKSNMLIGITQGDLFCLYHERIKSEQIDSQFWLSIDGAR
jgi:hypothetical protein